MDLIPSKETGTLCKDISCFRPRRSLPRLFFFLAETKDARQVLTVFLEYQTEEVTEQDTIKRLKVKDLKTDVSKVLDVTGISVEIGLVPNSDLVKGLVKLNRAGEVIVNCPCETTAPGIFAPGDVTTVPEKQIVIAVGNGVKTALNARHYLQHMVK